MGSNPENPFALKLYHPSETGTDSFGGNAGNKLPKLPTTALESVSVVVPVLNEAENLAELSRQIFDALEPTGRAFELILIDDGSTDDSANVLQNLVAHADETKPIRAILLAGNFGQTAALKAGIDAATGDYIVTLDGDLQNDPADIPMMLDQLDAGFEIVFGWREKRQDHFWSRKIPSQIANWLIRRVTGTQVRDLGCALKAIKREFALRLDLVGDMHRFIAVLANHLNAKSCEVPTRHRARVHGETKYGLSRIKRVILDLFVLKVLQHRDRPMQFFGGWALRLTGLAAASLIAIALTFIYLGPQWYLGWGTGLALLSGLAATQLTSIGLLAELIVRKQSSSGAAANSTAIYRVREVLGHAMPDTGDRRAA